MVYHYQHQILMFPRGSLLPSEKSMVLSNLSSKKATEIISMTIIEHLVLFLPLAYGKEEQVGW